MPKSTRPARPTKEQLAAVQPWITVTMRNWQNGEYYDTVQEGLMKVFGPMASVKKPAARDLKAVQDWTVDQVLRWGRDNNLCDMINDALAAIFPAPADDRFVDSEGYDCKGIGPEGYTKDGYDVDGRHKDTGLDRRGFDSQGYDRDGFNTYGRHRDTGLTREQWASDPANLAALIKNQGPGFMAAVRANLTDPTEAA